MTSESTNTHSEFVIFITFDLQHLLHERPSTLRYTDAVYVCYVFLIQYILYMLNNLSDVLRTIETSFEVNTGSKGRKV